MILFNPIFGFAGPMLQFTNNVARHIVHHSPLANDLYGGNQSKMPYTPHIEDVVTSLVLLVPQARILFKGVRSQMCTDQ